MKRHATRCEKHIRNEGLIPGIVYSSMIKKVNYSSFKMGKGLEQAFIKDDTQVAILSHGKMLDITGHQGPASRSMKTEERTHQKSQNLQPAVLANGTKDVGSRVLARCRQALTGTTALETSLQSYQVKHVLTLQPSCSTPRHLPE